MKQVVRAAAREGRVALREFECPNCGGYEMEVTADGWLLCQYCGSSFGEVMRICPQCGHYNEDGARHCAECGAQLVRDCPACGADNWALAEHCVHCGRNLDLIEHMARRWQLTTQQRLDKQRASMTVLKAEEERASQERMAALMEADRIRQEAIALAQAAQRERDRRLYTATVVGLAVFITLVILIVLWTSARG